MGTSDLTLYPISFWNCFINVFFDYTVYLKFLCFHVVQKQYHFELCVASSEAVVIANYSYM